MKRLLVTGASGLVGSAVARLAQSDCLEVIGVVGRSRADIPGLTQTHVRDLTDLPAFSADVRQWQPQVIINCAAVSEPGDCVANPGRSRQLNIELPRRLAELAHELGARLVHVSTEQVFGGDAPPYRTDAPVAPINLYGQHKAAGEAAVQTAAPEHSIVVRAPLLMGNSLTGRRSLHERLLASWMNGQTPRLFTDEIRQVAHADNLAAVLLELGRRDDVSGVHHWAGCDAVSRHALGVGIRQRFGLTPEHAPIAATTRSENPEAARTRPADLRLDIGSLIARVRPRPETFAVQLDHLQVPAPCREWLESL